MEAITALLHNVYLICQWHRHPFEPRAADLALLHSENVMEGEERELGPEGQREAAGRAMEDREGVSGAQLLQARRQLRAARKAIWQTSQRLVSDFLDCGKLDHANTQLVKQVLINDLCEYFAKVGARRRRHVDRRGVLRQQVARDEVEAAREADVVHRQDPREHRGGPQELAGDRNVAGLWNSGSAA